MIFLFGSVAALDIDNKLTYEVGENGNPDLKVDFHNSILGLIPTSDIGTAELKSHPSINYVKEVGIGNQVVMWYDFNFNEVYENGLGEVTFEDKRTGKEVQRNWRYVYWGTEIYEVPTYDSSITSNGTIEYIQNGTTTKEKEAWLPYNSKNIPNYDIRIGIEVESLEGDLIDGVWEIVGKKVSKHAEWTAALDVGLDDYYNFDDTSSSLIDVFNGDHNGTLIGTPANVTGKIGSALNFSTGKYANMSNGITSNDGTICFWAKSPTNNVEWVWGVYNGGSSYGFGGWGGAAAARFTINGTQISANATETLSAWNLFCNSWGSEGMKIFLNNVIVAYDSTTVRPDMPSSGYWIGGRKPDSTHEQYIFVDEVGIWERQLSEAEINQLWNAGDGITYMVTNVAPTITVFSPTNSSYSDPTIYINGTNSTEIGMWVMNYNGTNITNFNINTSLNIEDGSHHLSLYANGTDGSWGVNNSIYFVVDTTSPVLNITNLVDGATNTTNYTTSSTIPVELDWTSTDTTLNTCWFYNVSSGANETVTCNNNVTMQIPYGTHTFKVYANDSAGRLGSDEVTLTWSYKLLQNAIFYNENAYEILEETFTINMSSDGSETVTGRLFYNDTLYTTTKSGTNINANYTRTITVPSGAGNNSFYFSFIYGSEIINSSTYYQNVTEVTLNNCTTGAAYFSLLAKDEGTGNYLDNTNNVTIDTNFIYYINDRTANNTFNGSFNYNNVSFCLTPADISINVFGQVEYEDETHVKENYYFIDDTFTNSTTNITLYDLLSSDSTSFVVYLVDSSSIPVENAYFKLKRNYVATDEFKVVEMARSDNFGLGILHFVTEDETYRIDFYDEDGNLLYSTTDFKAVCLDTVCSLTFTLPFSSEISPFEGISGISDFQFALNKTNDVVYLVFNSQNSTSYDVLFEVYGISVANDTISLCSETQTSISSGSAECNVSGQNYNAFLSRVWVNGIPEVSRYVAEENEGWKTYGIDGVIWTLFIVIALTTLFAWHWALALIGSLSGLALSVWLQFLPGTFVTISYLIVIVIYLIVTGVRNK